MTVFDADFLLGYAERRAQGVARESDEVEVVRIGTRLAREARVDQAVAAVVPQPLAEEDVPLEDVEEAPAHMVRKRKK